MLFYTFCVDIKKHSRETLSNALNLLLNSIHKYIKNYKLLCFTNFKIKNIPKKYNIEYRTYYDNQKEKLYPFSDWLNLSFNKINIYKDLHDEFNKDFIWIDLDTVIYYDISYINDLANVFIENGGTSVDPMTLFSNNNYITVPTNIYIQGNFWKLNIDLYNKLMITLDKIKIKNLRLQYDLQDLFNYYTYIENNGKLNNINIIGNNVKTESINGLCVWSKIGNTHLSSFDVDVDGLNNVYINNNRLITNEYRNTKLMIAASKDYRGIIDKFLKYDVSKIINSQDKDGNTALHYATQSQDPYIIKKLIDAGANPYIKNNKENMSWNYINQAATKNPKMRLIRAEIAARTAQLLKTDPASFYAMIPEDIRVLILQYFR